MIADTIATGLGILMLVWGLYVTKHAHEYPEWFEDDVMWKDLEKDEEEK